MAFKYVPKYYNLMSYNFKFLTFRHTPEIFLSKSKSRLILILLWRVICIVNLKFLKKKKNSGPLLGDTEICTMLMMVISCKDPVVAG
jgi:hypothetical protein